MKQRAPRVPVQSIHTLSVAVNQIRDNPGSRRYPKQVGRGPGSGKGYLIIITV